MVSFTCDQCQDTITKPKVVAHLSRCRGSWYFSCLDCNQNFDGDSVKGHTSCVSEAQRYQGKLFKSKGPANTAEASNTSTAPDRKRATEDRSSATNEKAAKKQRPFQDDKDSSVSEDSDSEEETPKKKEKSSKKADKKSKRESKKSSKKEDKKDKKKDKKEDKKKSSKKDKKEEKKSSKKDKKDDKKSSKKSSKSDADDDSKSSTSKDKSKTTAESTPQPQPKTTNDQKDTVSNGAKSLPSSSTTPAVANSASSSTPSVASPLITDAQLLKLAEAAIREHTSSAIPRKLLIKKIKKQILGQFTSQINVLLNDTDKFLPTDDGKAFSLNQE